MVFEWRIFYYPHGLKQNTCLAAQHVFCFLTLYAPVTRPVRNPFS